MDIIIKPNQINRPILPPIPNMLYHSLNELIKIKFRKATNVITITVDELVEYYGVDAAEFLTDTNCMRIAWIYHNSGWWVIYNDQTECWSFQKPLKVEHNE